MPATPLHGVGQMEFQVNKAGLPPVIANRNLYQSGGDALDTAYDVVIAKAEKFVTPREVKGKTIVFSRISPDRIKADQTGSLHAAGTAAKSFIETAIGKLKSKPAQKKRLADSLAVQVKGNIRESSKAFFSADSMNIAKNLLHAPQAKLVRFVDNANTEIPAKSAPATPLPKEIVLPELPPET